MTLERDIEIDLAKLAKDASANIETVQMTADEARMLVGGEDLDMEELETCLDLAQGHVFTGEADVGYVLIKIVKG